MMKVVRFYVGLTRRSHEIEIRGYKRQPLILTLDSMAASYANATTVDFGCPPQSWGLIDGLALSTSMQGPVVAISPLLIPMFAKAGFPFGFAAGAVTMNLKSIDAILNRRPVLLGNRSLAS